MKIIYKQGDLLKCTEKVIVHGCNAQGVMGSGVALAIKSKYPEAYNVYRKAYTDGICTVGDTYCITIGDVTVVNAVTQESYGRDKWRLYADYFGISCAFGDINRIFKGQSIAIPKIGAGLANGDWNVIEKIIKEECTDVQVVCYCL
jgi:O-acetyl-ADP-ribose deacetylase (regulator of RNase III)